MTSHAMEEMAEEELTITDVEDAILKGQVARTQKNNRRGTKNVIEATAIDRRATVGAVGRFTDSDGYLIITVY